MDITVYSNKGERTLIWGQIYPQGPGFTASVQSILQLVNQFKNCSQMSHFQLSEVHSYRFQLLHLLGPKAASVTIKGDSCDLSVKAYSGLKKLVG